MVPNLPTKSDVFANSDLCEWSATTNISSADTTAAETLRLSLPGATLSVEVIPEKIKVESKLKLAKS